MTSEAERTDAVAAAAPEGAAHSLRLATPRDIERLRGQLADAFYEDPIWGWLMPDARRRRGGLRRFYAIELRHVALRLGRVWASEELSGAAISMPPRAWRVPPRALVLQSFCGVQLSRAARLLPMVERHHPREAHYYFPHIGVAPDAQGRGLGSALMRPTLDRCDREGLPAYLEASSERSAALYARLGFRTIDELSVDGSPTLRLMLRPPQPADDATVRPDS